MRHLLAAGTCLALLSGCAAKYDTVTPDVQAKMLADLQAGKPVLDCAEKCSFTWGSQVAAIHQLDLAERWNDLAVQVMRIGYGSDLAYYYLGQAAQGLGYYQASIAYYNWSLGLNTGANPVLKCANGEALRAQLGLPGDSCQGVDLAGSIPVLIQASRDKIAEQEAAAQAAAAPAPVVHHRHHKSAATDTGGTGWAVPPPAGSSGGTASSSSSSSSSNTGGTGWAVPPPAPKPASQ
jgi:hypothetical protein